MTSKPIPEDVLRGLAHSHRVVITDQTWKMAQRLLEIEPLLARMRETLRGYAGNVHELSWHGEMMVCDLCGSDWNNGRKRNEPATPEVHKPDCLLFTEALAPASPSGGKSDEQVS